MIALLMILNRTMGRPSKIAVLLMIIGISFQFSQAEEISSSGNLLKEVSRQYRENLDSLVTWTGEVQSDHESVKDDHVVRTRKLIDFAFHRPSGQYFYFIRDQKNATVRGQVETPRVPLRCMGELHRDNLYYSVRFQVERSGRKRVNVADHPFSRPAFHNGAFVPEYFLGDEGMPINEMLDMYAEHADDADVDLTVDRTGDVVTVERFNNVPTESLVYELDLSKNGMPLRTESVHDESTTRIEWAWQCLADVWVPLTVTRTWVVEGQDSYQKTQTKLKWTSSRVNVPLPKEALTLASLHVYRGDKLVDSRTGESHLLEDQKLPVRPAGIDTLDDEERDVALGRWLFGIGNVLLLIVLVAAFFWRRGKGRKEA